MEALPASSNVPELACCATNLLPALVPTTLQTGYAPELVTNQSEVSVNVEEVKFSENMVVCENKLPIPPNTNNKIKIFFMRN